MNFWEARQAALEGKKVRKVGARTEFGASAFQAHTTWNTLDIDAEWEIVDGPEAIKQFINVYLDKDYEWGVHSDKKSADSAAYEDRASCIELVVDENGKLISARNV